MASSFNYYDAPAPPPSMHYASFQQPQQAHLQHHSLQHQQQQQHAMQQPRNGGMATNNAHYALVQQQHLLSQQSNHTPSQSPYRQSSLPSHSSLPQSHHASPLMGHGQHSPQLHAPQQSQSQSQSQLHAPPVHQHPTRPMSANFKRELFPHEMQQQSQQVHPGMAPGPMSSLHPSRAAAAAASLSKDSPPPNLDEYKLMEQNVRSITESPPPDQVASMLSQILAPGVANKFGSFANGPAQQAQPTTHQQQLYAHFGYGGHAQQAAPKQHAYASPAAAIQLSQHQAQLAQSNHFNRPPVQPVMQAQQQQSQSQSQSGLSQPSYYDQSHHVPQQVGGMSPYGLQYPQSKTAMGMGMGGGPPAQLSPSQIPGMAGIVDPDYLRMLRERQRELHELQRNEANRAQIIKEQQIRQQQQQMQQQQQIGMGGGAVAGGQFQQPPPPLQVRSQSLPDQFGHAQSPLPNYYSQPDPNLQQQQPQQQYRQDLASPPLLHQQLQQQQQPGSSYPQSLLHYSSQSLPQQMGMQGQAQQQQQQAPPAGGYPLQAPVAALPPGFKADGSAPHSNSNSPPFASRQQQPHQSAVQSQAPSHYTQMQQLKHIVHGADGEFRTGAASPNLNGGLSARVPNPPLPRRSQSLGDPNGTGGMGMGVGAQAPPVSHEAVPISLGGRRGGGAEGGERAAVGANLSRFACGPPHQESRGFVARCCTEARRGRSSHSASSVLSRAAGFGTRRSSKDLSLSSVPVAGVSSAHATLALYNPYGNLASSPELPDSSPTPLGSAAASYQQSAAKPAPLATASPAASAHATPCASPHRHPAPRARMQTPLLPPTPK